MTRRTLMWKRREGGFTTKNTKSTKLPLLFMFARAAEALFVSRKDAKAQRGTFLRREAPFKLLHGACGAKERTASLRLCVFAGNERHFNRTDLSAVGQRVLVIFVFFVVNSLFPNVNAHGGRAAP